VVLTNGDVDAVAGLLTMREGHAFTIFATADVHGILDTNPIFNVLAHDRVTREAVGCGLPLALRDNHGGFSGLTVELFHVPGKEPLYLEGTGVASADLNVGVCVSSATGRFFHVPGCAAMTEALTDRFRGAPLVFFDGTFWRDDEMIRLGMGTKTGERMGHMSVSGPRGVLAAFETLNVARRIFIHINNSNPILLDDSPERAAVEAAGWEVAYDGMEGTP